MQRILILMSDTGGGHRASAQALKTGFEELYPGRFGVEIIDFIARDLPWPFNQMPNVYPFLSNDAPWLWKWLYGGHSHGFSTRTTRLGSRLLRYAARRAIDQHTPDLILSVHPLMQEVFVQALTRQGQRIPFVTVVTDLSTVHPLWFHPQVDAVYVASCESRAVAQRVGVPAERIHLSGLPIRPAFARPSRPKADLRAELGMALGTPAVLVVGGGEGIGPVEEIVEQCASRFSAAGWGQIAVICGRNRTLQERLAARRWPVAVHVRGFVENMPDWMAACDCIVTKAGPGTIAEALVCGLPIVLSGFIPGQEEGNVPYVVEQGVGVFEQAPAAIADQLVRWFGPERAELHERAQRARALGHPQATFDIVRSIVHLLAGA